MVNQSPALETLREGIIRSASAYLHNVVRDSPIACARCGGVTGFGYRVCPACYTRSRQAGLAETVGMIMYAYPEHQSGRMMRGYKSVPAAPTAAAVLQSVLAYAVVAHWQCAAPRDGDLPDAWAVVPSLRRRPGPHPLTELAGQVLRRVPFVPIEPSPQVADPRGFSPGNFKITSTTPGNHVLLLDDTWVSGGHLESSAAALHAAGARRVTALVVARWLDPSWGPTAELIDQLTSDFDPDVCPYTGRRC